MHRMEFEQNAEEETFVQQPSYNPAGGQSDEYGKTFETEETYNSAATVGEDTYAVAGGAFESESMPTFDVDKLAAEKEAEIQ